jgi:Tfp pilus assembly protein PilF
MKMSLRWLLVAGAIAALCACEMLPRGSVDAGDALRTGIRDYEEGRYLESFHSLRNALETGLPPQERVQAHKYIAFIYCVSNRSSACREEFRKALAVDPSFQLDPAEAGHPIWGPVFRSLKTNGTSK